MDEKRGSTTVIGRAGQILRAFGPGDVSLGLSELARRAHLPKPTAYRLAEQLVDTGLVARSGSTYELGALLFDLGQLVPQRRWLRDAALPFLEDVYVATRETVHLAVLDGTEVLYVEKLTGHHPVDAPSRVAGRMPLHCTATGKAILAHAPKQLFEDVTAVPLTRLTPYTVVVPAVLATELDQVRDEGFSVERGETRVGYTSVAAPVFGSGDWVVGALSVTGRDLHLDVDRVAPAVRTAARGLSRVLAGSTLAGVPAR